MAPKKKLKMTAHDLLGEKSHEDGIVIGGTKGEKFTLFYGRGPVFSNFHPSKFTVDGIQFCCGEQYFHYQKAVQFGDETMKAELLKTDDPRDHKRLGRKVSNYMESEWNDTSGKHMADCLRAKFDQNEDLRKHLFDTIGTTIVEASPRDRLGIHNDKALDRSTWRGQNRLGKILTEVRDELATKHQKELTEVQKSTLGLMATSEKTTAENSETTAE